MFQLVFLHFAPLTCTLSQLQMPQKHRSDTWFCMLCLGPLEQAWAGDLWPSFPCMCHTYPDFELQSISGFRSNPVVVPKTCRYPHQLVVPDANQTFPIWELMTTEASIPSWSGRQMWGILGLWQASWDTSDHITADPVTQSWRLIWGRESSKISRLEIRAGGRRDADAKSRLVRWLTQSRGQQCELCDQRMTTMSSYLEHLDREVKCDWKLIFGTFDQLQRKRFYSAVIYFALQCRVAKKCVICITRF